MNAEYRGVKVPDDVIDFIARHAISNIRELEGALVRVIVYASMNGVAMSREVAAEALSDVFEASDPTPTMKDVLRLTAERFGVEIADLTGKGRRQELVTPRQVAMYLIREHTQHSLPEIGAFFGGRDHSTVLYAVKKVQDRLDAEPDLRKATDDVRAKLV